MLKTALLIVVGFGSGTLGALVVVHRAPPPRQEAAAPAADVAAEGAHRAELAAMASAVARETSELRTQVAQLKEPQPALPELRELRESREHELSVHASLVEAHRQAQRDDAWAQAHETSLRGSYTQLSAELGFDVRNVDCRSHTCVLELQFPSADAAASHARELVQRQDVACGKRITLPAASSPSAPLTAEVYVDCPEGA